MATERPIREYGAFVVVSKDVSRVNDKHGITSS